MLLERPQLKSARKIGRWALKNQGCLSRRYLYVIVVPTASSLIFSPMGYFSAFLVAAMIFFVSFLHQGKKENSVKQLQKSYFNKNLPRS
ncbi:MAG: hypothetical protein ABIS01_10350 [Ferruginibacter sp.]